jgi:hypothetical protein
MQARQHTKAAAEDLMALDVGSWLNGKKRPKRGAAEAFRPTGAFEESGTAKPVKPAPKTVMLERPGSQGGAMRLMDRLLAFRLPLIGDKPVNTQVQVLLILLGLCFAIVIAVIALDNRLAANGALQIEIVGDTLMHTQRLAKAAPNAVQGNRTAFAELKESRDAISANLDGLANGDGARNLSASSSDIQPPLTRLIERWRASEAAASVITANEKTLLAFGDVIKRINDTSPRLQQLTEEITALKLQGGAPAREIATAGQLVALTQRLGKSANSLVAGNVANAEIALAAAGAAEGLR